MWLRVAVFAFAVMSFAGPQVSAQAVYQALQSGMIQFTWVFWQPIVLTGVGAGIAYLIKNIFSNSMGEPFKKEK